MDHVDDNQLAIVAKYARLRGSDAVDLDFDAGDLDSDATDLDIDASLNRDRIESKYGEPTAVDDPELPDVLAALEDDRCREILSVLSVPMAATELSDACDIPRSTVYRKIDRLSSAGLLREYTAIREDGPDATLYERAVTDITVSVDADGEFTVSIDRDEEAPEDRMATFWTEMAKES